VTGPDGDSTEGYGTEGYGTEGFGMEGYGTAEAVAFAPVPPQTGNGRIDEALGVLAAAGDAPPDQLVAPLTEADRALRETLDSIGDD
jgi:hypothetical protein